MKDTPTQYSIQAVAQLLNRHHTTIRRWIRDGSLRAERLGPVWMIPAEELNRVRVNAKHPDPISGNLTALEQRLTRVEESQRLLCRQLGYGSAFTGMSPAELTALSLAANKALDAEKWSAKERDTWAERVMRLREADIKTWAQGGSSWVRVYDLLVRMLDQTTTKPEGVVLRAKLERALGHMRALVYTTSVLVDQGPPSKASTGLRRAALDMGAMFRPTTAAVLRLLSA